MNTVFNPLLVHFIRYSYTLIVFTCAPSASARSCFLFSRKGAKVAKNFDFFSYTKNLCVLCALARFIFPLAEALRSPGTSMFNLFYTEHLCGFCVLARVYLFFSLAEALSTQSV